MIYRYILISIFMTVLWWESTLGDTKMCYKALFSESLNGCPNFENNFIDCKSMTLGNEDDEGSVVMVGIMDLKKPIDIDMEVEMAAYKLTEQGEDISFSTVGTLCSGTEDKNTPWYPMLHALNATKCPIEAKAYNVTDMTISLSFASEILNHEFVGEYRCVMKMFKLIEVLACYEFFTEIKEINCDE